jgi:hypothetical protein
MKLTIVNEIFVPWCHTDSRLSDRAVDLRPTTIAFLTNEVSKNAKVSLEIMGNYPSNVKHCFPPAGQMQQNLTEICCSHI